MKGAARLPSGDSSVLDIRLVDYNRVQQILFVGGILGVQCHVSDGYSKRN